MVISFIMSCVLYLMYGYISQTTNIWKSSQYSTKFSHVINFMVLGYMKNLFSSALFSKDHSCI